MEFQETGDPNLLELAKNLRDRINSKVSLAKAQLVIDKLEEYCKDHNKFWKVINGLFNAKPSSHAFKLKNEAGEDVSEQDTPEYINNYFSDIGKELFKVKIANGLDSNSTVYNPPDFDSYEEKSEELKVSTDCVQKRIEGINVITSLQVSL